MNKLVEVKISDSKSKPKDTDNFIHSFFNAMSVDTNKSDTKNTNTTDNKPLLNVIKEVCEYASNNKDVINTLVNIFKIPKETKETPKETSEETKETSKETSKETPKENIPVYSKPLLSKNNDTPPEPDQLFPTLYDEGTTDTNNEPAPYNPYSSTHMSTETTPHLITSAPPLSELPMFMGSHPRPNRPLTSPTHR